MQNFTIVDTLGTLKACSVLVPVVFAPGYVIGWALNLFEFRRRRPILRFSLAVPLTIAICPMLSYFLARFLEPALWAFYISASVACLLLLAKECRPVKLSLVSRPAWIALGLITFWIAMAIGSLIDLQIGNKLYPSITAYDHSTRVAVMAAIARHVPPSNPFFAHPSVPLRYHYLWMLLCGLPLKVIHLQPRHLMYASIIWCGIGLTCVIALGLKFLLRVERGMAQKALLGAALLWVTGLDILPTFYLGFVGRSWLADMEWWNEPQITSWVGSLLWVPHHVAALIACFVAFVLLRHQADADHRWSTIPVIVAGLAFASAVGLSVYVTFTFLVAIGFWLLALIARKCWREVAMFSGAGAVATLWALPYLSSLRGPGGGTAFVEFALRPFPLGIYLAQKVGITIGTQPAETLANAVFLPINYGLELGFFLAVGILRLRQLLRGHLETSANELACWTLVMASFLIGTFMRSSTISSNDLGWRCFLPAQLIMLLWSATIVNDWWLEGAVPQLGRPRPLVRKALATLVLLGILGTAYQVFMLRMFPILYDRGEIEGTSWLEADGQFGRRTYALRLAYETLGSQLPSAAVLQSNPATEDSIPHMLYSGHDTAAGGLECGTALGGERNVCDQRVSTLVALFELDHGSLENVCRDYGIDVIIAEDSDRAWRHPSSWIWTHNPIVSNDYVRAFRCPTDGMQLSSRGVPK